MHWLRFNQFHQDLRNNNVDNLQSHLIFCTQYRPQVCGICPAEEDLIFVTEVQFVREVPTLLYWFTAVSYCGESVSSPSESQASTDLSWPLRSVQSEYTLAVQPCTQPEPESASSSSDVTSPLSALWNYKTGPGIFLVGETSWKSDSLTKPVFFKNLLSLF